MLAVIRLYLLKSKRVPVLITGIMVLLILWAITLKILAEPDTPINVPLDLHITNLGLLIFVFTAMVKRNSMEKEGFIVRLPVSGREIVIANIVAISIISIITVILSLAFLFLIISFFKFAGYNIVLNYKKFNLSDVFSFAYYIMYLGVIFSTFTLLLQYTSKSTAKLLIIGTPIALLFLVPTILAIITHSVNVRITDEMIEQFFSKPFWHGVKVAFSYLWKARLVIGLLFTLFAYRVRYLKEV